MNRTHFSAVRTPAEPQVAFRKATLLDVPLVFDLFMEGSMGGAFTDRYLAHTGGVQLLAYLVRRIGVQAFAPAARAPWKILVEAGQGEVGFLKINADKGDPRVHTLVYLSIDPEHQGRGLGKAALRQCVAGLPAGVALRVYCTKYARAMQHLLKQHGFKRNPRVIRPMMEEYLLAADSAGPDGPARLTP